MEQMTIPKPNLFRKIPAEVRGMIFYPCLTFENRKRVNGYKQFGFQNQPAPSLLIALRQCLDLHKEALEVYYRLNVFKIYLEAPQRFLQLNAEAMGSIRTLIIFYS